MLMNFQFHKMLGISWQSGEWLASQRLCPKELVTYTYTCVCLCTCMHTNATCLMPGNCLRSLWEELFIPLSIKWSTSACSSCHDRTNFSSRLFPCICSIILWEETQQFSIKIFYNKNSKNYSFKYQNCFRNYKYKSKVVLVFNYTPYYEGIWVGYLTLARDRGGCFFA